MITSIICLRGQHSILFQQLYVQDETTLTKMILKSFQNLIYFLGNSDNWHNIIGVIIYFYNFSKNYDKYCAFNFFHGL